MRMLSNLQGCAESVRPAKNHGVDLQELVETGQLPTNNHHTGHSQQHPHHATHPREAEARKPPDDGEEGANVEKEEKMQADSPFSREAFEKGMAA